MHTYAYVLFSYYGQYTLTSSNKISMQAVCFSNIFWLAMHLKVHINLELWI